MNRSHVGFRSRLNHPGVRGVANWTLTFSKEIELGVLLQMDASVDGLVSFSWAPTTDFSSVLAGPESGFCQASAAASPDICQQKMASWPSCSSCVAVDEGNGRR